MAYLKNMDIKHSISDKPFHILAEPHEIAEKVIVVGDPLRAERISQILDDVRLVNKNRCFLTYTGFYNNMKITISTHGIGAPSAAIVFEELYMLGAKTIIRLGTAGSLVDGIEVGSVFIPVAAAYEKGGTIGMYFDDLCFPAIPDFKLVNILEEAFLNKGLNIQKGIVVSSDSFHAEKKYSKKWRSYGIKAVEMECATLFTLSNYKGFRSAAVLLIIDSLVTGEVLERHQIEEKEVVLAKTIIEALK